jgi:5-formyltetrahydrofolate cyclo-ligase
VESAGLLRAGRRIALYLPMAEEIDTGPLLLRALRRGCLVHVPRVTDFRRYQMRFLPLRGPLRRGHYGILEPAAGTSRSAQALDLILMPLVGFDRRGNRIGMGKGYYDRALAFLPRRRHRPRPRLVGLAYACQEVESLPARAHDVPLHAAVTEAGLLRFPPSPAITPGPA